jgi:hypothetical protein
MGIRHADGWRAAHRWEIPARRREWLASVVALAVVAGERDGSGVQLRPAGVARTVARLR